MLAACGGGKTDAPGEKHSSDIDPAETCDPREAKVCMDNDVVACEPSGHLGRRLRTCPDGCKHGQCKASCNAPAQLVYVVDTDENLLSFDPRLLPGDPFRRVGHLDCGDVGTPFSMAIDRDGTAWVLYQSGNVYEVEITDAKCRATKFRSNGGTFGMGYASDGQGAKTETLYIATNDYLHHLGTIDGDLARHDIGNLTATIDRNPELTGTGDGKLYGFYPVGVGIDSFIQEIDKSTGRGVGPTWSVGQLDDVVAYAFAQWGGVFYVFVTTDENAGGNSSVRAVDPKAGTNQIVRDRLPFRIVGAGVSTCAPEKDSAPDASPTQPAQPSGVR